MIVSNPSGFEAPTDSQSQRAKKSGIVLGFLVSGILLWLAVRHVNGHQLVTTLRGGNTTLLAATFTAWSCSYFARAERWRLLLGPDVSTATSFWGICAGYVGNTVFPARAGEVMRSVMVARATSKRVGYVLATAITERIADVIAMAIILCSSLVLIGDQSPWLWKGAIVAGLCAIVGILAVAMAPRVGVWARAITAQLPVLRNRSASIDATIQGIVSGTMPLRSGRNSLRFACWSVLVVSLEVTGVASTAAAFKIDLKLGAMLLFLAAMAVASAMPSTPGYIGVYQFVAVTVLAPFGLNATEAVGFAVGLQAVNLVVVFLWGGIGIWKLARSGWNGDVLRANPVRPLHE